MIDNENFRNYSEVTKTSSESANNEEEGEYNS